MKAKMKRMSAYLLAAMLVLSMGSIKAVAAENTVKVKLDVEYKQVDARTITDMVNGFRTGSDAWYWNSDDTTKTECTNLETLTYDKTLEQIAMQRAAELAIGYSHTRVNGEGCFSAFSEYNYSGSASGENIAAGYGGNYANAAQVFVGWREDDDDYDGQGHRRNMLSSDFTAIGMGHVYCNGTDYWAMELGNTASGSDSGVDGAQTVTVEVRNEYVKSLSTENASYTVALGIAKDLPEINAAVAAPNFWPGGGTASVVVPNPNWTISDTSVAMVSDGKITGQAVGTADLIASVGDAKVTIALKVTDSGLGSDDDNNNGSNDDSNNDSNNDNNNNSNNDNSNNNDNNNDADNEQGGNHNGGGSSSGNNSGNASKGNKASSGDSKEEEPAVVELPTTSVVGGVRTTTEGIYFATNVNGTIITTGEDIISKGYGLSNNEKPYSKFYNLDIKKSSAAKKTIDAAVAAQGAVAGPMLNIELGKMSAGKYSLLPSDGPVIRLVLGIPKGFVQSGKKYAVICVHEGGAYSVLQDLDDNPDTITFDTTGGAGAYAMIKY